MLQLSFCLLLLSLLAGATMGFVPSRSTESFHLFRSPKPYMVVETPISLIEESSTKNVLDLIIDESLRTSARRPIMRQYDPSSRSMWRTWQGTVFAQTWPSVLKHVLAAMCVYFLFRKCPECKSFFEGYSNVWSQGLSVTTFTLTFFVNQSYSLWRRCLSISRTLQKNLNDLILTATGCARRKDKSDGEGVTSRYSTASRQLLLVMARYVRLFNILSYASFARSHRPLVTPRGMRRLVARGLLTEGEKNILVNDDIAATQRHNVVLQWILRGMLEGNRLGHFDEPGFSRMILSKTQEIRGEANSMEAVLRARMPFAYTHMVQVLIDVTLWMYPIMAFSQDWSLQMGLLGSAFLSLFYQGLFDLAKRFLDPFHNENFWSGDDALLVDTLIAETNAGSLRWVIGLEEMPMSLTAMKKGAFNDYVLPNEGYTVEEAREMELAKEEKEAESLSKLTPLQVEQQAAELLETAKQEYEETKLIMETPAGYEFVPGLDDKQNEIETTVPTKSRDTDDFLDATADEKIGEFLEEEEELLEEVEEDYETFALEK